MEKVELKYAGQSMIDEGMCVIPCFAKDKHPKYRWKQYQEKIITISKFNDLISRENFDSICVITGEISGNFETIDFDQQGKAFESWKEKAIQRQDVFDKLIIESTQSGGVHVSYRCEETINGNLKLASDDNGVLIETRGEGGLVLIAPSKGYELMQGEYEKISTLSEDERCFLLDCADSLNEKKEVEKPTKSAEPFVSMGGDVFEEYNRSGDIDALLTSCGWTLEGYDEKNQRWRRPEKDEGVSATWNGDVFYCFSSNAHPFKQGRGYNKFQVFCELMCLGDIEVAKSELIGQGFGADYLKDIDVSGILQGVGIFDHKDQQSEDKKDDEDEKEYGRKKIPEHLINIGGTIGEIYNYSVSNAYTPNKVMAFVGAISCMSMMVARKVKTVGNVRPNVYMLGLSGSSTGKEFPRSVNKNILSKCGFGAYLKEEIASSQGVEDSLMELGQVLIQTDEIDGMLKNFKDGVNPIAKGIEKKLLSCYSSASSSMTGRMKSGQDPKTIVEPHLSLFGVALPSSFYDSLSEEMLTGGFFSRCMVLEAYKREEPNFSVPDEIPESIIEAGEYWKEFQSIGGNLAEFNVNITNVWTVKEDQKSTDIMNEFSMVCHHKICDCERMGDDIGMSVWGRGNENMRKMALIRACSDGREDPNISGEIAKWAVELVSFMIESMLYKSSKIKGDDEIMKNCDKIVKALESRKGGFMMKSRLMRKLNMNKKSIDYAIETLVDSDLISTHHDKSLSARASLVIKLK